MNWKVLNKNKIRELCYVVTVDDIRPIPGKDRVECAVVGGWTVMVRKDEFKVGEPGIYFEIDSRVPEKEPFLFLSKNKYKIKTQRYKTAEGAFYSQGLLMSAKDFGWTLDYTIDSDVPFIKDSDGNIHYVNDESRFLTEQLGITYAVQEDNERKAKPIDPYKKMCSRYPRVFSNPIIKWIYKRNWGKKLLFCFFGKDKQDSSKFPTHFPYIKVTDEERCVVGDTKILTIDGKRRIADIVNKQDNTLVWSYDYEQNKFELKKVVGFQKYDPEELIKIKYKKSIYARPTEHSSRSVNSIICTKDHKLMTNNGYKKAIDINNSDKLMMMKKCYTNDVLQFIYGTLLGDSNVAFDRRNGSTQTRIKICHSKKQYEYLLEKLRILNSTSKIQSSMSGFLGGEKTFMTTLDVDETISQTLVNDGCIQDRKFYVTKQFCDRLTIPSLAWWFLDDGSLRHREHDGTPRISFSTYAFDEYEVDLLIDVLKRYGFNPTKVKSLNKKKTEYWFVIDLSKDDSIRFIEMIKDYVPPCMQYKLFCDTKCDYKLTDYHVEKQYQLMPIEIISIERYDKKRSVYDITVEDNHNFIANDILNHNCENIPEILNDKSLFSYTLKIDGTSTTFILERKKNKKPFESPYEFYVCSRKKRIFNEDQQTYHELKGENDSGNVYWQMAKKYNIESVLTSILDTHPALDYVCIQGETAGVKLQGNPHKLPDVRFYAFNYIDSIKGLWESEDAYKFLAKYEIPFVPIISNSFILPDTLEEFKKQADGSISDYIPDAHGLREGFVYRKVCNPNISFKNVSREYLIKKGE